jgi:hypothetical protein
MEYSKNALVLSAEAIVRTYDAVLLEETVQRCVEQGHVRVYSGYYKQWKQQLAAEDAVLELLAEELQLRHTRFGLVPYIQ